MGQTAIAEIQVCSSHSPHTTSLNDLLVAIAQFADYIYPAFDQVRVFLFSRILVSYPGSCKFPFTRLNSKIISPACRSSTKPRSIVTALAGNLMLVVSPYGRRRCPLGMAGCTTLRVPRASFSALLASRCVTVTHLVVVYILRSYRNQLCRSSSPGRQSRRRAFC